MQQLKLLCLLLFLASNVFAQDSKEIRVKSTIEKVTVYKKNARIVRKTKSNVPAGKSEIVLEQLSQKILINSIQVKISNKAVALVSAAPRINYLKEAKASERFVEVDDSIQLLSRQLEQLVLDGQIIAATKSTLMNNNPLGSSDKEGFSVAEVKEVMDFRRKELTALEKEKLELTYKKKRLNTKMALLRQQLNALANSSSKPSGEIVLQLQAASAASTDIEVTYVVTSAGWTPLYDIKSDGVGKPLELVYKAKVYQATGFDWEQVSLSLSSSDPSLSHDRPILNPMKLNLMASHYKAKKRKGNTYIQYQGSGDVVLESKDLANRNISSIVGTTGGVNVIDEGEAINSNGSRSSSNDTYIDGVRVIGNFGSTTETVITEIEFNPDELFGNGNSTVEFELALLQDIPSDGEEHIVEVNRHEVEVGYEYHIVPKLDKGAFLLAKITNYGKYNLLSGPANIFFEGAYLGQSFIDSKVTTDTLLLSLGRDEKISVLREKLKSLRKEAGGSVRETLRFEISIRNNKQEEIEITVLDQIPVSKNKELEVKLLESTSAVYYEPYGSLRWRKKVKANNTEKIKFEYEVKYPKDRGVQRVN